MLCLYIERDNILKILVVVLLIFWFNIIYIKILLRFYIDIN